MVEIDSDSPFLLGLRGCAKGIGLCKIRIDNQDIIGRSYNKDENPKSMNRVTPQLTSGDSLEYETSKIIPAFLSAWPSAATTSDILSLALAN